MGKHISILVVSEAGFTGYARVATNIISRLNKEEYSIYHFALNCRHKAPEYSWPVILNQVSGDSLGYTQLLSILNEIKPQILFLIYDMYLYAAYRDVIAAYPGPLKTILYTPVDGIIVKEEFVEVLSGLDHLVVFTEFAKNQLVLAFEHLRLKKNPLFIAPPVEVIPHGIDNSVFYPLEGDSQRGAARKILFPGVPAPEDAFIVLNANRNTSRKRIDLTLEAFALFSQDKPENVKLFLHMNPDDRGYRIVELAKTYHIHHRLIPSGLFPASDKNLNLIYNACDVGVNTSSGEGWGLASFEHAATKAAQIVPRHSACAEIWDEAGVLIDAPIPFQHPLEPTLHHLVKASDVAAALELLYASPTLLADVSHRAYQLTRQAKFQWDATVIQWDALFKTVPGRTSP